jgi:hypothetical protein
MEKAVCSNGQFRNLTGSLNMIPENDISRIDGVLIQKAINQLGNGTTQSEFINWINNGCRLNIVSVNEFTVGDIFCHRAEAGDHRLWFNDDIQNWLIKPNLKKIITINSNLKKLLEYRLSQNMNDSSIQENTNDPGFMTEEEFFLIFYLLIFQSDLAKQVLGYSLQKGKWYIFHGMVNGKETTFYANWDDDGLSLDAYEFGINDWWSQGDVFLFLSTKARA